MPETELTIYDAQISPTDVCACGKVGTCTDYEMADLLALRCQTWDRCHSRLVYILQSSRKNARTMVSVAARLAPRQAPGRRDANSFFHEKATDDKSVHAGREESAESVGRRVDDSFAPEVEAGVQDHGDSRDLAELVDEPVI